MLEPLGCLVEEFIFPQNISSRSASGVINQFSNLNSVSARTIKITSSELSTLSHSHALTLTHNQHSNQNLAKNSVHFFVIFQITINYGDHSNILVIDLFDSTATFFVNYMMLFLHCSRKQDVYRVRK